MQHIVTISSIRALTHDVLKIVTEKPANYSFAPGQATMVSIHKIGWIGEERPFTFTCLPGEDYLEFIIKTYIEHEGVTNELRDLTVGDELIVHDVFGAIKYEGEGVFIAGGAGVTPFIAILRQLESNHAIGNNKLLFANKTQDDIILEEELKKILHNNCINVLSDEAVKGYEHGQITEACLKHFCNQPHQYFYLCGPPPMIDAIEKYLLHLQVDEKYIVKEKF
ncbi:MAG: flavodoxin reductase [Ignavibacteria bacterium]|nr:flavodoxin reductase [Ignavibacteria bacterium]